MRVILYMLSAAVLILSASCSHADRGGKVETEVPRTSMDPEGLGGWQVLVYEGLNSSGGFRRRKNLCQAYDRKPGTQRRRYVHTRAVLFGSRCLPERGVREARPQIYVTGDS